MQNRKSLLIILIPILFILILVIIKSLNKNSFGIDVKQTFEISQDQKHILSVKLLKEKLLSTTKIVLIDLRNSGDFANGHLKNASNIPFVEILNVQQINELKSSDNEIVLYSSTLIESSKAWTILTQMGYQKLYILDIPADLISEQILEKDTLLESNEVLKYKFQPDTLVGLE